MAAAVGVARVIVGMARVRVIVVGVRTAARGSAGPVVVAAGVPGVAVVTVVVHAPPT